MSNWPVGARAKTLEDYAREWIELKAIETETNKLRREVEDKLVELAKNKDEGTENVEFDSCKVSITKKLTRKVDAQVLEDIINETDSREVAFRLFRWKPEINTREWKAADELIKSTFAKAITTAPARAYFKIEAKGEK